MRNLLRVFANGMHQMLGDGMLLLLLPAPFLMGAALYFLLPIMDGFMHQQFGIAITAWYPMSDALLATVAPVMTALICAFVILDERDEGTGLYYRITPSGRYTYLMARIALPMLWAYLSTSLVLFLFSHNNTSLPRILLLSTVGVLQSIASCMLLVAIANNKVEGLALAKLTNIFILGFVFPWFIASPLQYIFGFLPSFWIGQLTYMTDQPFLGMVVPGAIGIISAVVWIRILTSTFLRRIY
jgi:fluoroquinolone transport system permease protein